MQRQCFPFQIHRPSEFYTQMCAGLWAPGEEAWTRLWEGARVHLHLAYQCFLSHGTHLGYHLQPQIRSWSFFFYPLVLFIYLFVLENTEKHKKRSSPPIPPFKKYRESKKWESLPSLPIPRPKIITVTNLVNIIPAF